MSCNTYTVVELLLFIMVDATIHLIPKWRRPRMVWVELHENEASRATEHEILRSNHREMDRHTANSGKKNTKTANITRCLHDFEKPRLLFRMNTFTRSILTKIKVISIIDRAKCFHSFKVRDEPHNLKLALCIVSGEVEYAYCGPSCTAGKSGFCNHILALMCPLV